jgi:hypothetical protein
MAVLRAEALHEKARANSRCLTQAARKNIDGKSVEGRFPGVKNDKSRHKGRDSCAAREAPRSREPPS